MRYEARGGLFEPDFFARLESLSSYRNGSDCFFENYFGNTQLRQSKLALLE